MEGVLVLRSPSFSARIALAANLRSEPVLLGVGTSRVEPPFNRSEPRVLRFLSVARRFPWNRLPYIEVAARRNLDRRLRAAGAPCLSIVDSLPEGRPSLDGLASDRAAPCSGPAHRGGFHCLTPSDAPVRVQYEVSTPRRRFRPVIRARHHPFARPMGHDCLAVRLELPHLGSSNREELPPQHHGLSPVLLAARSHSAAFETPGRRARHRGITPGGNRASPLSGCRRNGSQVSNGSSSPPWSSHSTHRALAWS